MKNILILLSLFILSSCGMMRDLMEEDKLQKPISSEKALVLAPVTLVQNKTICGNIGEGLEDFMSQKITSDIVYGKDITALNEMIKEDNLIRNGQLRTKEISEIGKTLKVDQAYAFRVLDVNYYPPQRVTVKVVIIDVDSARTKEQIVAIDLNDKRTVRKFRYFLGTDDLTLIKEKYFVPEDKLQTAMLSNKQFHRFCAAYITEVIKKMKKN